MPTKNQMERRIFGRTVYRVVVGELCSREPLVPVSQLRRDEQTQNSFQSLVHDLDLAISSCVKR
jgi:hypothetical protein